MAEQGPGRARKKGAQPPGVKGSGPWGPEAIARAFIFATEWLGVHVEEVNALNVYPVPDGDTGTNMHLTLQSVRRQLVADEPDRMEQVARALSYGSLLGARGNSGVILSQVLKGFADSIKAETVLDAAGLSTALLAGSDSAYAAVMKPVEGTILTVVRESAAAGEEFLLASVMADAESRSEPVNPVELLRHVIAAGRESLARTPDLLPILKQAGVVDAGALGYLHVLDGVLAYFEDRDLPPPPKIERRAQEQFEEEAYGFCTEFLLADVKEPTSVIRELVAPFGDSLLVVGAEGFVKGHIHTEEPEKLLAAVAKHGRMIRSKVEDMSEQHSEILADVDAAHAEPPRSAAVAVANGYGITRAFRGLGVRVVGGGQTDNPSVEDIADAVRSVGAHDVLLMPNNKNIIMAAQRVGELVPGKRVLVLPTKTLGQGLAAAVLFQEGEGMDQLFSEMEAAAESSLTLEVTWASRAAEIDGVAVKEGDAIGLIDGKLVVATSDAESCLLALLDGRTADYGVATLFHSSDVGPERVAEVSQRLHEAHPDLELEVHPGGPDLYPYLLVLE